MNNGNSKNILESSYVELLGGVVDDILLFDDQQKALELLKLLEQAMTDNIAELQKQPELWNFYKEKIIQLKFICFPIIDDSEAISLIKNNFCAQFKINNYDILNKLKLRLINIVVIGDRDKFKEELKSAILDNEERIIKNNEIKTIRDWLKNYIVNIGLDEVDNLAKAQYLMSLKNSKTINPAELNNLFTVFKFYDQLTISSASPEGFEEDIPVVIDNKLYVLHRGVLELVPELKGKEGVVQLISKDHLNKDDSLSNEALNSAITNEVAPGMSELEQALANYSESSLEYKAIKQEINRLKVGAFRRAQKK